MKISASVAAAAMLPPFRELSRKSAKKMLLLWSIAALSSSSGVNGASGGEGSVATQASCAAVLLSMSRAAYKYQM